MFQKSQSFVLAWRGVIYMMTPDSMSLKYERQRNSRMRLIECYMEAESSLLWRY